MTDESDKKIQNKNEKWGDFARSIALSIITLIFGSLIFSGFIEGYKDDLASKRAIVTEQFRPMRETAVNCHDLHNKLVLEYGNLAGSYALLFNEIKRVANAGDTLGSDYVKIGDAAVAGRNANEKEVERLKRDTDACYNKLFLQYEELSIVTASYDDFLNISSLHFKKMNLIYKQREEDSRRMLGDINASQLWENFVQLVSERGHDKETLNNYINNNPKLFSVAIDFNNYMSKNEEALLEERDAIMNEADTLFSRKINSLFSEGFFHRLFRVI